MQKQLRVTVTFGITIDESITNKREINAELEAVAASMTNLLSRNFVGYKINATMVNSVHFNSAHDLINKNREIEHGNFIITLNADGTFGIKWK